MQVKATTQMAPLDSVAPARGRQGQKRTLQCRVQISPSPAAEQPTQLGTLRATTSPDFSPPRKRAARNLRAPVLAARSLNATAALAQARRHRDPAAPTLKPAPHSSCRPQGSAQACTAEQLPALCEASAVANAGAPVRAPVSRPRMVVASAKPLPTSDGTARLKMLASACVSRRCEAVNSTRRRCPSLDDELEDTSRLSMLAAACERNSACAAGHLKLGEWLGSMP